MSDLLQTGEVAKQCGVSVDTVRHYERKGVIAPAERGENGYRRYPPDTVERVALVRRAVALGFSLDELARIFRQRASGRAPCREVRSLAARKMSELDDRIAAMISLRDLLATTLRSWDDRLAATPDGQPAHLLDSLIERKTP
jgi:DNA-binding transcriptional MerR regulator